MLGGLEAEPQFLRLSIEQEKPYLCVVRYLRSTARRALFCNYCGEWEVEFTACVNFLSEQVDLFLAGRDEFSSRSAKQPG